MRTASIDAVLGPVADAVSDFLLANEDAEVLGIFEADLHAVATSVAASVRTLNSTAASAQLVARDDIMAKEMPPAMKEVDDACNLLLQTTAALKDDPRNSALRKRMIEAANGILSGTRRVLEVYDDHEVRKVVWACDAADEQINALRRVGGIEDLVDIMQIATQSLVTVAHLADRRVGDLLDPWLKEQLNDSKEAVRSASTLLVSSMKSFVMRPKEETSVAAKNGNLDRLAHGVAEIRRIVQLPAPPLQARERKVGKLATARMQVTESLLAIQAAIANGDRVALQRSLDEYGPATAILLDSARDRLQLISDPDRRAEVSASIDRVTALKARLEAASRYALEHPDDIAAQQAVLDLLREIDEETTRLDHLVGDTAQDDVVRALASLGDSKNEPAILHYLVEAARSGNVTETNALLVRLDNSLSTLRRGAAHIVSAANDPLKARAVEEALSRLEALKPQIAAAARNVAQNPKDAAAREYMDALVAEWEAGVANVKKSINAVLPPEETVASHARGVEADLKAFEEAIRRGDVNAQRATDAALVQQIQAAIAVARSELENTTDPVYQAALREHIKELEAALPELQSKMRAAAANPHDSTLVNAMTVTGARVIGAMSAFQKTMAKQNRASDPRWRATDMFASKMKAARDILDVKALNVDDNVVVVHGPPPRALTAEEARADPIKASAMSLRIESSKWSAEGNKMISAANALSDKMARLSDIAKAINANEGKSSAPVSKAEFIRMAREIAADVKAVEVEARRIAKSCTDKRLVDALVATVDRIPTISTQLRILSTVKATSAPDPENDEMLVHCATNLMDAVKGTISSSQAAHIRAIDSATNAASVAHMWRRQVFTQ